MSGISRNLNGPYRRGVPNPYTVHVHPYPTRFHGGIYTRPEFGLPFVRNPHAVFKPDDFYSYYGVEGLGGLGSFGGSSLGNGTIGGTSLGLGATGTPIYWHGYNTKTKTLQSGLNKVLTANQFREIGVDGKLGAQTCAALGICRTMFPEELLVQVPEEIIQEALKVCDQAIKQYPSVKKDIETQMRTMVANRDPIPPEPLVTPTQPVPVSTAPVVPVPGPAPLPPPQTPPTPQPTPPLIHQSAPPVIEIPEVDVVATPPKQEYDKQKLAWGLGLVVVAGAGYYFWSKKRKGR